MKIHLVFWNYVWGNINKFFLHSEVIIHVFVLQVSLMQSGYPNVWKWHPSETRIPTCDPSSYIYRVKRTHRSSVYGACSVLPIVKIKKSSTVNTSIENEPREGRSCLANDGCHDWESATALAKNHYSCCNDRDWYELRFSFNQLDTVSERTRNEFTRHVRDISGEQFF